MSQHRKDRRRASFRAHARMGKGPRRMTRTMRAVLRVGMLYLPWSRPAK